MIFGYWTQQSKIVIIEPICVWTDWTALMKLFDGGVVWNMFFLSCLKKFNNSRWWCQVQEHGTECHQLPERSREAARRQTTNHQLCRCWAHVLGDSATRSTNNEERLMNHLLLDLLAGSRGVGWIPMIWEWSNQWIDLSKKLQETTFFFFKSK